MSNPALDYAATMTNEISPVVEAIIASLEQMGEATQAIADQMTGAMGQVAEATQGVATSAGESAAAVDTNTAALEENATAAQQSAEANDASAASTHRLNLALLGIGAAIAVAGVASVKAAGDFQAGIITLVTGAGEAQSNIGMVSQGILQMAADTGTATSDLIAGMYQIDSSNIHGADSLKVLRDAAEGAKVGNADLATVTHAVVSALTAYGLGADDAATVTNTLIATVASGNMHMQDLSAALGTVMPAAKTAGVNLLELGAALAVMTSQGTNAANAATYLKQMLVGIEAPGSKAQKALDGIGLSATQVAETMRKQPDGMIAALTDINAALDTKFPESARVAQAEMAKVKSGQETMDEALANLSNNTSPAYVNALKDIAGGSKNMQAMLELTGTGLQTLTGNFTQITHAVTQGQGSITGWNLVQDEFNQKVDRAKEAVEVFFIGLGTQLLPTIGHLADVVTGTVVPALQNAATLLEHHHDLLLTIAAALGGVVLAAIYSLAAALAAPVAAALPLIAAFAGISAAVALVVSHWHDIEGFFTSSAPLALVLKGALATLGGALLAFAVSQIPVAIAAIGAYAASWIPAIALTMAGVGALLVAAAPFLAIGAAIAAVIGILILLVTHWQQVTTFLGTTWKAIETLAKTIWNGIAAFFSGLWNGILTGIQTAWTTITSTIANAFAFIQNLAQTFVNDLVGFFSWLYDHNYYFHDLVTVIEDLFSLLKNFITIVWTAITSFLGDEWRGIQIMAQAAWNLVKAFIITPLQDAWSTVTRIAGWVVGALQSAWNSVTSDVRNAWTTFTNVIATAVGAVSSAIGNILNAIKSPLTGLANDALGWGKAIIQSFIDGITSMAGAVGNAASGVANSVKSFLGFHSPTEEGPGADADTWSPNLMHMYINGIAQFLPAVQDVASHVADTLQEGLTAPLSSPEISSLTGKRSGVLVGNTGTAASVGLSITIVLDRSLALLDPQYRTQIAQGLAGDIVEYISRQRELQTNALYSYPGR
jgi:TP901 family phage tail tape measure protein